MSCLLSLLLLCLSRAVEPTKPPAEIKIDLTPLKEPLDKAAVSVDRAVKLAENAKSDLGQMLSWSGMAVASLVTAVVVNIYHSRQLRLQKEDRRP